MFLTRLTHGMHTVVCKGNREPARLRRRRVKMWGFHWSSFGIHTLTHRHTDTKNIVYTCIFLSFHFPFKAYTDIVQCWNISPEKDKGRDGEGGRRKAFFLTKSMSRVPTQTSKFSNNGASTCQTKMEWVSTLWPNDTCNEYGKTVRLLAVSCKNEQQTKQIMMDATYILYIYYRHTTIQRETVALSMLCEKIRPKTTRRYILSRRKKTQTST